MSAKNLLSSRVSVLNGGRLCATDVQDKDATLITGVFQTLAASDLFLLIYSHSKSCVRSMSRTVDKQDLESGLRNTLRCQRSVLSDLHLIYIWSAHLRCNCTFLLTCSFVLKCSNQLELRCCFLPQCSRLLRGGSVSSTLPMHSFQVLALNLSISVFYLHLQPR